MSPASNPTATIEPAAPAKPGALALRAAPAGLPDVTLRPPVVADALVRLQANWLTDYRNATGIVIEDGAYGPTVTIEDSSRVDPWIVRQVGREVAACDEALEAFSRLDRVTGDG